jgi:hypothetical protein
MGKIQDTTFLGGCLWARNPVSPKQRLFQVETRFECRTCRCCPRFLVPAFRRSAFLTTVVSRASRIISSSIGPTGRAPDFIWPLMTSRQKSADARDSTGAGRMRLSTRRLSSASLSTSSIRAPSSRFRARSNVAVHLAADTLMADTPIKTYVRDNQRQSQPPPPPLLRIENEV